MHYYIPLQCTFKCHINITTHPLHTQAYFLPKISHSEHSYSNHRLLILREIFDRIFFKTGNYHSFDMFLSFVLLFLQKPFFYFFYLTKEIIWIKCIFLYSIFDTKKAVKNRISTVRSNPHETCDETEEEDKRKTFWYIRKCVA